MNTNTMELKMNEMEQVSGGGIEGYSGLIHPDIDTGKGTACNEAVPGDTKPGCCCNSSGF